MYEEIKKHMENNPKARERKNKNRFIAWLLCKKYSDGNSVAKDKVESLIVDSWSYDRAWRKVLQENANLRGSDYEDKIILEQEKQIELGYEPMYHADLKGYKT